MHRRFKGIVGCLVAGIVALAILPAAASAGQDSESYVYEGHAITAEQASSLVCGMQEDVNVCYDSEAAAQSADLGEGVAARAADCPYGYDHLFEYNLIFGGATFYLGPAYIGGTWQQYNSTNTATTTSFRTGVVGAKFNGHADGKGANYPEGTPACSSGNLSGTAWNNRFRSRKRLAS